MFHVHVVQKYFSTTLVVNIIANIQIKNGLEIRNLCQYKHVYSVVAFHTFLALSCVLLSNVPHTDWSLFFNMNPCQNAHLHAKIVIFQTLHGLAI